MKTKSKKLWSKGSAPLELNVQILAFTSSDDLVVDQKLIKYDVYGSLAHLKMLRQVGLISETEAGQLHDGLTDILSLWEKGKYLLQPDDEDMHTGIEGDLSIKYPIAGQKIHTGRSRNDQVLVDLRLYTKEQLINLAQEVVVLAKLFQGFAQQYQTVPMPGYTHMQPAMLSSVGLWAGQFSESLLDDLEQLKAAYDLNDQSPLGSGAAYGVSLPIDRKITADLLGFSKVQINALYCQNSKGKIESSILNALVQVMLTLGRLAQDLLLFTMAEFSFFKVDTALTTGSSIMPQKKNLDVLELVRARVKKIISAYLEATSIVASLPSGYNRDTQEIKKILIESVETTLESVKIVQLVILGLVPNESQMAKNISKDMFAAHFAFEIMKEKGLPFREAYQFVGQNLESIPQYDPKLVLTQTTSLGAPGNLQLKELGKKIKTGQKYWKKQSENHQVVIEKLIK